MAKRILIMGLPGSGKTTLAIELLNKLAPNAVHFNADAVRQANNDWDFSTEGRIRQAHRMRDLADTSTHTYAIADFVAPLPEMRDIFAADYTIWIDTIHEGRFADTNKLFQDPSTYDLRITEQNANHWAKIISDCIKESDFV